MAACPEVERSLAQRRIPWAVSAAILLLSLWNLHDGHARPSQQLTKSGIQRERVIILTDIDGLYSADPRIDPDAVLIPEVETLDRRIQNLAGRTTHATGRGGMYSKIKEARPFEFVSMKG